jgi:hypothetical protein
MGAQTHLSVSQTKLSRALEDSMSAHDSFAASGSSPTRKKKTLPKADFRVEFHGAIVLLFPLSDCGFRWIERHIGADNGYQPYYPTVILEPRYLNGVIAGIRKKGLVAR